MEKKIKVLIITYLPWRDDNSIGNSYSNIFKDTDKEKYEFAHIYIRDGMPQNKLCHEYYHISEKALMRRIMGKKVPVGRYFHVDKCEDQPKDQFSNLYNKARILRWQIFFFFRDMLGYSKAWKTKEFDNFLDEFNPDLVFGTLPTAPLIYRLMTYVKHKKNIPLITYPWDDYYSLRHFNFSPVFWIRRGMIRGYLRKTAAESEYMYVITNLMQDEYREIFKKDCRLLFKGHEFDESRVVNTTIHAPINIVYMGNIGGGRWKTLAVLAKAVKVVNEKFGTTQMTLNVYTLSPKDNEIIRALNIPGCSRLNDSVPNDKVNETMDDADILVHAEPYARKDYQFYRASFSTKLVDYFSRAKAILSIGGMTASTDYLIRNDATIYVQKENIVAKLQEIAENPGILQEYAQKSWNCGVRNHQIKDIQERMYNDFKTLLSR